MPFTFTASGADARTNPTYALGLSEMLAAQGVTMPDDVVRVRKVVDELTARSRSKPRDEVSIESDVLARLAADPTADITPDLSAMLVAELEQRAVAKALHAAHLEHGATVYEHRDELIQSIAAGSFAAAVRTIEVAARLPSIDLDRLAHDRNSEGIVAVADARDALKRIRRMQVLRLQIQGAGKTGVVMNNLFAPFGLLVDWYNPAHAENPDTDLEGYIDNLNAGAEPWFGTPDEMRARADEVAAEHDRAQTAARDEVRRRTRPDLNWNPHGPPKKSVVIPAEAMESAMRGGT